MNPARAVTDGTGRRLTLTSNCKTQKHYTMPKTIIQKPIEHHGKCMLFELVANYSTVAGDKYQLLGRHLLNKGHDRNEIVEFGSDGGLRSVILKGYHYRSKGYHIFKKFKCEV